MAEHDVHFTRASPETVLPALPAELVAALKHADSLSGEQRRAALGRIAAASPRCLDVWASLAEGTDDDIERYAFARVGYHRGLDALRAAGWRGSGNVRWRHEENRGFLRSLEALRQAAAAIGEVDEEERCDLFLRQLDPDRRSTDSGL
jgi:hypothetical protein